MDELVTVIVPVYNMREYMERCILSITSQSYAVLQIILVDDGSTDGSEGLCDSFAERDARIEVIHRPNGGLSAARNTGLDKARGEWISFVDSDDYVSPYYIEDMLAAVRDNCDIVVCCDVKVPDSVTMDNTLFRRLTHVQRITGYEASVQHFGRDAYILNLSWGKLFRAHLWEKLRYPDGKINEDVFVSHALLYSARHIALTDAVLYAYVQSDGSIMRSDFTIRRLDILDAWHEGVRFFKAVGEPELAHIARRVYCTRVFDAQCICKKCIPHEGEVISGLRQRAHEAHRDAKPIRGYIDCSPIRAFAYRVKLFLGRWCLPLYGLLFVRGRMYI